MEYKHFQDSTPSSGTNHLVEKVRNSNINCDSPFRLLPNISTPPSRVFKTRNPFESPLLERLHLPICSPGLFTKSTPQKDEKFVWSICDISHLKPAEIDTNCHQEDTYTKLDPQTESVIQDKITKFFRLNSVVPSPAPREANEIKEKYQDCAQNKNSLCVKKLNTVSESIPEEQPQCIIENNIVDNETNIHNHSNDKSEYLPEDVYYKKLFNFESKTPETSPLISPLNSPLQFSPLKELEVKSFSDEMDKKSFNDCVLSPITPENETAQKDTSKNMSTRELKSACRLVFSDGILAVAKEDSSFGFDLHTESSLDNTITEEFISNDVSDGNLGTMSIDEVFEECEDEQMEISLIHTPKTGLFASPRKRLSDSFKELHHSFTQAGEINESNINNIIVKSGFLPEGSSDLGYHSENVATGPSMTENTWNSLHVFSSTPTRRKS